MSQLTHYHQHHQSQLEPQAVSKGKDKNAANKKQKLECGPMPNLMVALPNIGGTLCSTPQSLADAHY